MFSKKITDTDLFLDMPMSAQCLYFHLNMEADDDGFLGNAKTVRRKIGASEDDFKLLMAKEFIIPFESGVVVIKDWKIHNYIQKDRYNRTMFFEEKSMLTLDENNRYRFMDTGCIQDVSSVDTQVRLGKDRLDKDIKKNSIEQSSTMQKRSKRSKVDNVPKLSSGCPENVAQSIELEYRDKSIEKENKEEPKKPPCKYSDEHLRLAQKLQNNLINDFPSEMKRVNIEKWADTFRLIVERDQQTIAAIDYVLDWLPKNSFWFGNIRSASKLRTQFEKLKFEIKNEKERGQQRTTYQRQNVRTENLPEWAKEPNNQQEEKLSPEEQAELDRQIKEFMEGK